MEVSSKSLTAMHVVTTDDEEDEKDFYISTFSHSLADLALTESSELASQSVWEKFQFGVSRSALFHNSIIPYLHIFIFPYFHST